MHKIPHTTIVVDRGSSIDDAMPTYIAIRLHHSPGANHGSLAYPGRRINPGRRMDGFNPTSVRAPPDNLSSDHAIAYRYNSLSRTTRKISNCSKDGRIRHGPSGQLRIIVIKTQDSRP
jgi:hypothetical protein